MTPPDLRLGQAHALHRALPGKPDRLALYAALTDSGRRPDTLLLERSDGPSLLLDQAAVRFECRGHEVSAIALSKGGRHVLRAIAVRMRERIASEAPDRLDLSFPPPEGEDAEKRLMASSPFDALRTALRFDNLSSEEAFTIACLGVVAFDHVDMFESLPVNRKDPLDFPDYVFWLAESLILFEPDAPPRAIGTAFGADDPQEARRAWFSASERLSVLVARCAAAPALSDGEPASLVREAEVDLDDDAFAAVVTRLKDHIAQGDVYQIVPSRTFRAPCPDPLASYAALRQLDPSPYQFFVAAPRHTLFGASPETSVRLFRKDGWKTVEVKPIAGTRPRGASDDEDDRMEAEMRLDAKETAEHMMLVDLARNDVARISIAGTRRVARLMTVERYARVMHLVSSVTGVLKIGFDAFHALQACLNVGTLSGAPKIRAVELLRETEVTRRGPYGGAVGWINSADDMDTGVVIRSATVMDGTAFVRAGAGVVHDSDPRAEADETRRKASAVLSAIGSLAA